ncbi:hypothetical protein AciM339_0371 [Aciduliprofundum sp. MAR08-339]|uniref:hypothetical protein n=1 Tax=Aciduliprofundum sp. (strain MAR08-339) TaxID=673860 RepID=UPI0002A49981|nr:hypothetical protein AciM339_0371 [Aciduliprofundum sp. MAR08-339]
MKKGMIAISIVILLLLVGVLSYYEITTSEIPNEKRDLEIRILVNQTNFNVTITIFNKGNKSIPMPNVAYTYILQYPNGTTLELYRPPSNCTALPLSPEKNWTHTDNLYSFQNVKNGKKILKLPTGKFELFARYKSANNPYHPKLPYETTDSNIVSMEALSPLKASHAKKAPVIDGKVDPEEWNDANIYNQSWKNGGPYAPITNGPVNITLALKYDEQYLYVLFIIRGAEYSEDEELRIITENYIIYAIPHREMHQIPESSVEGDFEFSYVNATKAHIFEIKLNINAYFSYKGISPFNIVYVEDQQFNWHIVPVGGWNNGEPGLVFSV